MFEKRKNSDCGGKTIKPKGFVMTDRTQPVESITGHKPEKPKPAASRKPGDYNLISLWDECGGSMRLHDHRKDGKGG